MKRNGSTVVLVLALVAIIGANSVSAQVRLDLGVAVPRGFGSLSGGELFTADVVEFLDKTILPFPEAGVYYQLGGEMVKFGVGGRFYTFILETVFWPNIFAEISLGDHFVMQGQIGGGLFGYFGLTSGFSSGAVFFPDISAWFKIGKVFRVGAGALGLFLPELDSDTVPYVWYLGLKLCLGF